MNLINRIVVILFLVVATAVFIVLAVIPEQIVLALRQVFDSMEITFLDRIVLAVVAIVATIASAVLIRFELARERPRGVVLGSVEGASAQLATDSIAERLKHTLEALPDVRGANPKVISRGRSVSIWVTLQADQSVDPTQKATEAVAVIRDTVEKGMGVKIAKGGPKVDIKYQHGSPPRAELKR